MHETGDGRSRGDRAITRRTALRATAGAGAALIGTGTGLVGGASAGITGFQDLGVSSDNRIVDESGETFELRGLSVPDPRRMDVTKHLRGKTAPQLADLLTDGSAGWYPRAIRVQVSPVDVGKHPVGWSGPEYGEDSPPEIPNDRSRRRPPQPKAFERPALETYVEDHLAPIVERCRERGVYCVVDFNRHWHEQPPGDGSGGRWDNLAGEAEAENHLPYESDYTNYWAKNTHYGSDGEDVPASWGYVDDRFRNEYPNTYVESESDLDSVDDHPYRSWEVNQALVDEAVLFWDVVAERFADDSHVVFEAYDEPTAPGIWGPVGDDCGAVAQKPLWDLFVEDFAGPIVDAIREHAPEKLVLMGTPAWSTSARALHWRDFEHENLAVTWHTSPDYAVSDEQNWLNDTDYGGDPCDGWQPKEALGLQDAMDVRPVVVSKLGWEAYEYSRGKLPGEIPIYDPPVTEYGTTEAFGEPLLDALEGDDRIGWIAGPADVRVSAPSTWVQPPIPATMFRAGFDPAESTAELVDGNYYETPADQLPEHCSDLPCEWTLWSNPNMGEHVKARLADLRNEKVPFVTDDDPDYGCETDYPTAPPWPAGSDGNATAPQDVNDDGVYEDVNANCRADYDDVVVYFRNYDEPAMAEAPSYYDLNGNNRTDADDVVQLFERL